MWVQGEKQQKLRARLGGHQGPVLPKGPWGDALGFRSPAGPDPGGRITAKFKKINLKLQ